MIAQKVLVTAMFPNHMFPPNIFSVNFLNKKFKTGIMIYDWRLLLLTKKENIFQ